MLARWKPFGFADHLISWISGLGVAFGAAAIHETGWVVDRTFEAGYHPSQ